MAVPAARSSSRSTLVLGWTLLVLAMGWALLNLHKARGASWDEWEFLRATDYVRRGQVPFRDFWEHHTPLQWYLMAPVEALAPRGGNTPLLWLRWAQVPLWGLGLAALYQWLGGLLEAHSRRLLLAALLATPLFTFMALEYRVDTLSTLLALLAALAHARAFRSRTWALGTGALWSLAALANLRLAPMVLCGLVLLALVDPEARRWRLNPHLPAVVAGALAPVLAWAGLLLATHSLSLAFQRLLHDNAAASAFLPPGSGRILEALAPLVTGFDVAGLLLMLAGLAGTALALWELRRPGPVQAIALLQLANLLFIFKMRVHYPYHFQAVLVLMVPLAAYALIRAAERHQDFRPWPSLLMGLLAVQIGWNGWSLATTHPGVDWAYQDAVIRRAEAATRPDQRILDGCGAVLNREPAYRFWFLPLLVRILSRDGQMEAYSVERLTQAPPGAVLFDLRLCNWLQEWPPVMVHTVTHYLPDYANLWLPGMSWLLSPRDPRATWVVPATGAYRILAAPGLAQHPWFKAPLSVGMPGTRQNPVFTIDPASFLCEDLERIRWKVNGQVAPAAGGRLQLCQGDRLEAELAQPEVLGLMVVPVERTSLFRVFPGAPDYDVLAFYKEP